MVAESGCPSGRLLGQRHRGSSEIRPSRRKGSAEGACVRSSVKAWLSMTTTEGSLAGGRSESLIEPSWRLWIVRKMLDVAGTARWDLRLGGNSVRLGTSVQSHGRQHPTVLRSSHWHGSGSFRRRLTAARLTTAADVPRCPSSLDGVEPFIQFRVSSNRGLVDYVASRNHHSRIRESPKPVDRVGVEDDHVCVFPRLDRTRNVV